LASVLALGCASSGHPDIPAPGDKQNIADARGDQTGGRGETDVRTLGWIRVRNGRLTDEFGRQWIINGINARIEGIFDVSFEDGRERLEPIPAFDETDADAMVGMGFNMLRLPINWSGVEPREGLFSEEYLERVDKVVEICGKAGLYVLVDFHQDAWSKEIGEDGAPIWAIIPPPEKLLSGPLHDLESRRKSAQVLKASASFFTNKENIQNRFLPAWRKVTSRYSGAPHVIGFEPMNEPVCFHVPWGNQRLYEFYEKTTYALREVDRRHSIWLEPESMMRNQFLYAPKRKTPFPDDNVVYQPHLYPPGLGRHDRAGFVKRLSKTFDDMVKEGASWGGATVIGEWGHNPADANSREYFDAILELADERHIGLVFWLWKEHCQGFWGFFDHDAASGRWTPRSRGIEAFSRPRALAVPGELATHRHDAQSGKLTVEFESRGGESAPLLHLPRDCFPEGFTAELDGKAVSVNIDEKTRRALVPWNGQAGFHRLVIRPAACSLR